jgi:hypothetical protein
VLKRRVVNVSGRLNVDFNRGMVLTKVSDPEKQELEEMQEL